MLKLKNWVFTLLLVLGVILSIFRGFDINEPDDMILCNGNIIESSRIIPVIKIFHNKVNKDCGDVKERLNRYQYMEIIDTESEIKKNVVVVEAVFENTSKSEIDYNVLNAKLVLKNGKKISVDDNLSANFSDTFKGNFSQIGNIVFRTNSKDLAAIEFPDGSVCGI